MRGNNRFIEADKSHGFDKKKDCEEKEEEEQASRGNRRTIIVTRGRILSNELE